MAEDLITNMKAAYYTGCFANYYDPQVGEATVKVLQKNGIEVIVPDNQVCCGLPMIAKGNIKGAYKNITRNTEELSRLVSQGYALITTCPSCALFLKQDYPRLLDNEPAKQVSRSLHHISEYLLRLYQMGQLNTALRSISQTVFYHTPCHLKAQGSGDATVKMLQTFGAVIKKVSEECCGMGGAYGNEKVNYELSKNIASRVYSEIRENPTDRIVTDCGGCKLQVEAGTGLKVDHPIILVEESYRDTAGLHPQRRLITTVKS